MKIGIIGMGLIGGSLGRAILKNTSHEVYGSDTDDTSMQKAILLSACTKHMSNFDICDLDMVIFALCPSAVSSCMEEICPKLKDGAIVIDTCGNKRQVIGTMKNLLKAYPHLKFVGCHPMAGREFSGISHSTATLFEHAYVIMVPVSKDIQTLATVKKLFLDIGAQDVEVCSAERHDEMISYTSQLAHIVSSAYIKNDHAIEHAGFSSGSFRDMTRVAKLNPSMWTELFLDNQDNLLPDIEKLLCHLEEYRDALQSNDAEKLHALLNDGVSMKEMAENARKERMK